jgi:DegV family protein with EDD domain
MKTAIITDSTAYLTKEEREKYHIHLIPLSVNFTTETFEEEVSITASEFYEKVRTGNEFPKTTQPSVGAFVTKFEELAKDYDEIVTIHLSSGISGTYSGAIQAAQMVEDVKVYAFDSEVACAPQGMFAIEAAKMAAEGASGEEIIEALTQLQKSLNAYFIVEDLSHLQRGGRISATSAFVGGLLQVKPILCFRNKVIVPFEKIRTRKKAMKRVEELLSEEVKKYEQLQVAIIHANCEQDAHDWVSELRPLYPTVEFKISYFGPVIGTHLGEGSIAMGWMAKR